MTRRLAPLVLIAAALAGTPATAGSYHLSTIAIFNGENGDDPFGKIALDGRGNLFGLTFAGGAFGVGGAFRVDTGSGKLTLLSSFDGSNGAFPFGGVSIGPDGNLYGTTLDAGPGGFGTLFRIDPSTGVVSTLVAFDGSNGALPLGGVAFDAIGNVYGTTTIGGNSDLGTLFRYNPATGELTTLASFDGPNGGNADGGIAVDALGNVYGMTQVGGDSDLGAVYVYDAAADTLATLASFDGSEGSNPFLGNVVLDGLGNLYGNTNFGGVDDQGTVFRIDLATGAFTTLVSFDEDSGSFPYGELVLDGRGSLFGTTPTGGPGGSGTVFRIDLETGSLETIAAFDGTNGGSPYGLAIDSDGTLYGTTEAYPGGRGSVFRLTAVPEPSTIVSLAIGLGGFAGAALRSRRAPSR
ncbi:MAG: PEP-CTERM sorting domain-containing protein [Isosphaeraceae bacterium]|nr:PEP-CTERM sorting domain-containing protein [Isosphaeraceae bacterium]